MKYIGILTTTLAALVLVPFSPLCTAQSNSPSPDPSQQSAPSAADLSGNSYKTRPLPQLQTLAPFPADVPASAKADPLEYRSKDQISDTDRSLVATAEPKIRDEAILAGMEFDRGNWSYQQLICKALPGHVFLLYREDNGRGDVSRFSASIPRDNSGGIRVISIERRGYSLFTAASVNPLTVSAFNRIRADEPENKSADWLATALCYASLAGARPEVSPPPAKPGSADLGLSFPPTLEIGTDGESTVRFVDVASALQPTQWALTFSPQGQLLKVVHFPTPTYAVRSIP
jgi:hypothetical protein